MTGNYIDIHSSGKFIVGRTYYKGEQKWKRGTEYKKDGKEEKYDCAYY